MSGQSVYTATFKSVARKLQDITLSLDKVAINTLDIGSLGRASAEEMLGSSIHFLEDKRIAMPFLRNMLGDLYLILFNSEGDLTLSHEHWLLLYHKFKRLTPKDLRALKVSEEADLQFVLGLLMYYGSVDIAAEFEALKKACVSRRIVPLFDLTPQSFGWKRCKPILRRYTAYFTKPPGYNAYLFEYPNLATLAYLLHVGLSLSEAEATLRTTKGGLICPHLPVEIESALLYTILGGGVSEISGPYKKQYTDDVVNFASKFPHGDHSVFSVYVKPIMIEFVGLAMHNLLSDLKTRSFLHPLDAYIYHVSPYRFGLAVKDTFNLEDLLTFSSNVDIYRHLKEVEKPCVSSLSAGRWL